MISEKMMMLGKKRSVIREIFEYGNQRKKEIGSENVFDFSLGNPSIPAPETVNETIRELTQSMDSVLLHGYTSAPGDYDVRKAIAEDINERHKTALTPELIYMTAGAAASLTITIRALAEPEDEFMVVTPYFPEYRVFVEAAGATLVEVMPDEKDLQVDAGQIRKKLSPHTKAVILNSPNNPSGVVYRKERIVQLCEALKEAEAAYGHPIFLIADEPYRELVYDNIPVPYLMNDYEHTIVCYSFSKSLSLPGERIGYIAVSDRMKQKQEVYAAVCGAGRALGYVCAPSLFQRVAAACVGQTGDVSVYKKNRDLLYNALTKYGYHCIYPDGAFYLFVKAFEEDAASFCERAKKYELLLVPGDDFGCPGYVRIAYCVTTEQIERSLPSFERLAEEYRQERKS